MKPPMVKIVVPLICTLSQALVGAINFEKNTVVLKKYSVETVGRNTIERRLEDEPWIQLGSTFVGTQADGDSVTLSDDGTVMATGSGYSSSNNRRGKVQIFEWTEWLGDWVQRPDIEGEAEGDMFGMSLSLSSDGQRIAIGGQNNDGNGVKSGHVRIFDWNGSSWDQIGSDIDGEDAGDKFGRDVKLSGDGETVAIGVSYDSAGAATGSVRVFEWYGFMWLQKGDNIDGEAHKAKWVAISENGLIVAVGTMYNDSNGNGIGDVRVYQWDGSAWSQMGSEIVGSADKISAGIGLALSSDGAILAVGFPTSDDTGSVQIYQWSESVWTLRYTLEEDPLRDQFGSRLSLSNNGMRLAVSAPKADGNFENSGSVQVFESSDNLSSFHQLGSTFYGEGADDQLGSCSLSGNGLTLVVGTKYSALNGDDNGYAQVFQLVITPSTAPSIAPTLFIAPSIAPTLFIAPSIAPTLFIAPSIAPTFSISHSPSHISSDMDQDAQPGETAETISGAIEGPLDAAGTLTSRDVDGDLYRQAAGELAFNITTVRMESEFDDVNLQNELHLVYDYYAPSDSVNTTYDLRLYEKDCITHGENSRVASEFISISHTDTLHLRNKDDAGSPQTGKAASSQVHLAGKGYSGQSQIDIPLDIHQDKVFQSPYFEYEPGTHYTMAHIQFCARFVMFYDINNDGTFEIHQNDPYLEIEAVNFHETLVSLTFNLTQDFQVSDISLQKDAIIERSDMQRLKYELMVYHCEPAQRDETLSNGNDVLAYDSTGTYPIGYAISNSSYEEVTNRVITQSTIVYMCLNLIGNTANVGIREIAQLEFVQPASQITSFAVYKRTPNAITTESHYGEMKRKRMVISTRLVLPFFDNKNPAYGNDDGAEENADYSKGASKVIAKGTVIMMFQDDANDVRYLLGFNRNLQEVGQESKDTFEVELDLGYDEESSGYKLMLTITWLVAGALSFAAII